MWYVYVLQSTNSINWFYKGSTDNLKKRFGQHQAGEVASSKYYKPFRLVYYEAYVSELAARKRESGIKNSGSVWAPLMKRIKNSLSE